MWTVAILASLWMGLTAYLGESAVNDFENNVQQYDIVYHHGYHLLLAVHEDRCYFINTPPNKESTLDDQSSLTVSRLQATELSLLRHIQRNASGEVTPSTLEAVRAKYHDLLADFHCLSKHIFEVNFYNSGGSGSHSHIPSCEGKAPGMYADPRDCHAFILCDGAHTFHEICGPGTAFLESSHNCDFIHLVPSCPN